MKHVIYLEDLCQHEFVVHMGWDEVGEFLERRRWNDDIECGGDQYSDYTKTNRTRSEKYEWLSNRSEIVAIATPTDRWTDRVWTRTDG